MENSNCCTPNKNGNSDCNQIPVDSGNKMKKNIGMFIMGLALLLAISSAFKTANYNEEIMISSPSIEDFDWMETDKKVAYVLIQGSEKEENKLITNKLKDVVLELNSTDGSAEFFSINSSHQQYENFMEEFEISSLPTVVILGRVGSHNILSIEQTNFLKLMSGYISATTKSLICNPTSCSPSKKCTPSVK